MVGPVLVGALLLALVQPAHAACGVVATAFDGERAYPTVVDAVVSMRRAVLDESVRSDREFVGGEQVVQAREVEGGGHSGHLGSSIVGVSCERMPPVQVRENGQPSSIAAIRSGSM